MRCSATDRAGAVARHGAALTDAGTSGAGRASCAPAPGLAGLALGLLVGVAAASGAAAQDAFLGVGADPAREGPLYGGDPIEAWEIQEHVDLLASDALAGRGSGSAGERRAAAYLIDWLQLEPVLQPAGTDGYLQPFDLAPKKPGVTARNVMALLPGSDPELAEQVIVVGAHYDHVGTSNAHGMPSHGEALELTPDVIFNGADDNASGSAVLLELALSLATSERRPRRSVLFQWYSGEELGLLGSKHWVDHPTLPLERVVAMVNMDMVGRPVGRTFMAGGVGTSPFWEESVVRAARAEGLEVVLQRAGSAPSDNMNFFAADIPALFLFSGLHADYHRSGDDAHKLEADGAARIGGVALRVLRDLDALPVRPRFTDAPGPVELFQPKVFHGLTLDDAPAGSDAVAEVVVLVPDSPAGRAGVREGDLVLSLDGAVPADVDALEDALAVTDPERTARQLLLERDGEPVLVAYRPQVR